MADLRIVRTRNVHSKTGGTLITRPKSVVAFSAERAMFTERSGRSEMCSDANVSVLSLAHAFPEHFCAQHFNTFGHARTFSVHS
jgi:hypothetical protein